jgi:hypothetical protein
LILPSFSPVFAYVSHHGRVAGRLSDCGLGQERRVAMARGEG